MSTNTSIIGTMICGSSSRGSASTAYTPSSSDATMTSGVSFEWMKAAGQAPATPVGGVMAALR